MLEIEQFAEDMIHGLSDECWNKMLQFIDSGQNSLFIYEQVLTPAMRYIGSLWEQNLISVAEEHLASGICDILLARYATLKKPPLKNGYRAMFLCVEEEAHYFGLKMVSSLFVEHGYDTRFYGPNLPLESALVSAMSWKPDIIGLSASMAYHLPTMNRYVEAFGDLPYRPAILIGGRLVETYGIHQKLKDTALFIPSMLELDQWIVSYQDMDSRQTIGG